jgi:hypothetical protein
MQEDGNNIYRWFAFLARAAQRRHPATGQETPEIANWSFGLAEYFVSKGERWWPIARNVAKAVCEAEPARVQGLTTYSSILRRTGQAKEAMVMLKANGGRFQIDRAVLYEWGTVAGMASDAGLAAWLQGRSMADGGKPPSLIQYKLSLAGLGVAFRDLFAVSQDKVFAAGQAACGQLGLRLPELDERTRSNFQTGVEHGRRNGITDLLPEQAVEAIRKATTLGANEVDPQNNPVNFEKLLGEPSGYRYTALLRLVAGIKAPPTPQQTRGHT